jgi:AAA+ superfamily predicted ATPase
MDNSGDLRVLLDSRYPLLLVETREEERFLTILRGVAAELDLPVWIWSATRGLARDGHPAQYRTADAVRALDFVAFLNSPGVFVFADAHPALGNPLVIRRAKEIAAGIHPGQTLILTGPQLPTPPELAELAHRWKLRPPARGELEVLIHRTIADLRARDFPVALDEPAMADLVTALGGLTLRQAARLVRQAALHDGEFSASDVPRVMRSKAELLAGDGILEIVDTTVTLDDVAGFADLKRWWAIRSSPAAGTAPPRGVLMTGIPGCGKSLVAKAIAGSRQWPLVLLDPGRLYGKFVGESETRLAAALDTVDAMAPAVLWIDEIEKGFATGGDGDGGVSRRLLGTFLRWMQERPPGVFLVATANDVSALAPEMLRKGRFDEVFFVDLPDGDARRAIFRIHLALRDLNPGAFDLDALTDLTSGFSGAEIETAIVGAHYRAAADAAPIDTDVIAREIKQTVPLSASRPEDVARLRSWAGGRAVTA